MGSGFVEMRWGLTAPRGDAAVLALGPHLEQRGPRHLSEPLAPRLSTLRAYNKILCLGPTLRVSFLLAVGGPGTGIFIF